VASVSSDIVSALSLQSARTKSARDEASSQSDHFGSLVEQNSANIDTAPGRRRDVGTTAHHRRHKTAARMPQQMRRRLARPHGKMTSRSSQTKPLIQKRIRLTTTRMPQPTMDPPTPPIPTPPRQL
jgi:hypothetical protein